MSYKKKNSGEEFFVYLVFNIHHDSNLPINESRSVDALWP